MKKILFQNFSLFLLVSLTPLINILYCTYGVSIFIDYCTAPCDTEKGGRRGKRHSTCSTTGKPTRSFATERVSLDSV
jgi:hypothetical protein